MSACVRALLGWGLPLSTHCFRLLCVFPLISTFDTLCSQTWTCSSATSPDYTVRLCLVFNTSALYSGGLGFKSRSGDRLSWPGYSWFFSVTPGKYRDSSLKLGHDRFFPHSLFFLTYYYFTRRYMLWVTEKASLNKLLFSDRLTNIASLLIFF
jgi:hypothetical protein